ncbi:archease [Candidatus Micrarchaeota archaeon]|nr:archease [Candidatus Micrarchaeota archaeon]MBU2476815.1 archease [Candidatus Micrarchaeota archaeon]
MQFEYLEHTADLKFRSFGKTREKLIENSGKALCNAVIDLKEIEKKGEEIIELKAENFEELLFEFLKEVLYDIDANENIFSEFKVLELKEEKKRNKKELKEKETIKEKKVNEKTKKEIEFKLKISCFGEKINLEKHEIKTEIKAITKHGFKVEKKEKWIAEVLVDV